VLKLWQGLGYYSRARNLHASAKQVVSEFKGKFPDSYTDIKSLKGVGDYTAAAIASFAYNLPHAVVDGNVYRVLSRIFGIETPIDSGPAKKQFQELADSLLDKKQAALHNQAIMEFGSQYCKPVNPDCVHCMFNSKCEAYKTNKVLLLPIKSKKTKVRNRYFNYLVLIDKNGSVALTRRGENDIWQGLYEFNLLETDKQLTEKKVMELPAVKLLAKNNFNLLHVSNIYKHVLSHQHLYARFFVIQVSFSFPASQLSTKIKTLQKFAFPRLIEKFLDDCVLKDLV
jgi:A/G-specific adenine glycosylase